MKEILIDQVIEETDGAITYLTYLDSDGTVLGRQMEDNANTYDIDHDKYKESMEANYQDALNCCLCTGYGEEYATETNCQCDCHYYYDDPIVCLKCHESFQDGKCGCWEVSNAI